MAEVNLERYKANSYKAKAEAEREQKEALIPSGSARKHTKTAGDRFKESMFRDGIKNVGEEMIFDVAIPAFKDLLVNSITAGIEMLFYGEARPRSRSGGKGSYISYDNYSRRRDRDTERHRRSAIDFDGLDFDTKPSALKVLRKCMDDIEEDGYVTVGRMYEYARITPSPTDYNYGWTNLDMVEVYPRSDGQYVYRYLPEPRALQIR